MKKILLCLFVFFSVAILFVPSGSRAMTGASQVEFKSVSLRTIKLVPGGEPVTITMKGINLNLIDSVKIFHGSREYGEVKVRLGRASASSQRLTLQASSAAKPYCCLSLQFRAGKQVINASQKYVRVEIVACSFATCREACFGGESTFS